MDRINLYRIFVRVIEARSFTRAADTLRMPRSSVSGAIAELETRIGARLLNRTTRSVSPTHEGELFYERCQVFLADAEDLEAMFLKASRQIEGRIRVDLPGRIGRLIVAPALPEFLDRWPGIQIDLGMTDRTVDLVGERVDCALRVGTLVDSGLSARKLGEIVQINVASPAYLSRYGVPHAPADLCDHWQVAFASPTTGRIEEWEWQEAGQIRRQAVPWQASANSAEGYIACGLAGIGLIQIPAYDVAQHLASGALVEVMPAHRPAAMPMSLVFPGSPRTSRRLQIFSSWLGSLVTDAIAASAVARKTA